MVQRFALLGLILLAACQKPTVEQETAALTLGADSMASRQMQMRRYDTHDEAAILAATAGVLQDLGFIIDEAAPKSGLVVASKDREAIQAQQVAGQLFIAALVAALGGRADPQWDQVQKIRVSIVTKPSADGAATVVRVTFQRVVWNNKLQISHVDTIDVPDIYQKFFDKLSQAVFLEAHQI